MRPNMIENLTPVPIEQALSGLCDKTDAAWRIGSEFLKPFPEGWSETLWSHHAGWTCTAISRDATRAKGWPERGRFEVQATGATPDEARRLCREEAERKAQQ